MAALVTLAKFSGSEGSKPKSGLIADAQGNLYGTAQWGGSAGLGTVFKVDALTHSVTTLVNFTGDNGANPYGGLFLDAAGNLFGTTEAGGSGNRGTVFKIAAGSGTLTTLVNFNWDNGANPKGGVIADSAGNLYGTTTLGPGGAGTVYEVSAGSNKLTTLSTVPGYPFAGLTADATGNLYGIGINGSQAHGGVFKIAAGTNTLTTVAEFNSYNGRIPQGSLIVDAAGNIFGTASFGGSADRGTVFEIAAGSRTITVLATFNGSNGATPVAGLTMDAAGNLYGTTSAGGSGGWGTVFKVAAGTHVLTTLASFDGTNGYQPYGTLLLDAAGNLYGTNQTGVFQVVLHGPVISSAAGAKVRDGVTGVVYQATGYDVDPGAAISWSLGGADKDRFTIDAATGKLRFVGVPDAGAPQDSGRDNRYDIVVIASDGSVVASKAVTIAVLPVPVVTLTTPSSVTFGAKATVSGTLNAGHEGDLVVIRDDRSPIEGYAIVNADLTWSGTIALSGYGPHTITALLTDAAGQTGASATVLLTRAQPLVPPDSKGVARLKTDAYLTDPSFTGVTGLTVLSLKGTGAQSVTLGALADAAFTGATATIDARPAASLMLDARATSAHRFAVRGTSGADSIAAGAGGADIWGNGGADTLVGGAGNDTFRFDSVAQFVQAARINGGAGRNTLLIENATAYDREQITDAAFADVSNLSQMKLNVPLAAPDVTLGANAAAAFNNNIYVFGKVNVVDGSALGAGTTLRVNAEGWGYTLKGGAGKDSFYVSSVYTLGAATIDGGGGTNSLFLTGGAGLDDASFAHVRRIDSVTFQAAGANGATLGANAEAAFNNGVVKVYSGSTTDGFRIDASGLSAKAVGEFHADHGVATMVGGPGKDSFWFTAETWAAAYRTVDGNGGNDRLVLNFAGTVKDSDFVGISNIFEIDFTGTGLSTIKLGATTKAAFGSGNVIVVAQRGASVDADGSALLSGFRGIGGAGNDRFTGGVGADKFTGNGGADTFVLGQGGQDVIRDFDPLLDKIVVAGGSYHDYAALSAKFSAKGGDTVVSFGTGNQVWLQGVAISSLSSDDFIFA